MRTITARKKASSGALIAAALGAFAGWAAPGCMPADESGGSDNLTGDAAVPAGSGGSGTGGAPGTGGTPPGTGGMAQGTGGVAPGTGGTTPGTGGAAAGSGGASAGSGGAAAGSGGRAGSGGSGNGGAAAGGTVGSAGAGGDSLCTPGRYVICEGFETTAAGTNVAPAGWTRTGSVDIVSDAANVYRGTRSMRINAAASGPRRITKTGADVVALGGSHWGRVFYKVQTPAPRPASGVIHSTLVGGMAMNPTGSGTNEVRVVDTVENAMGSHQFLYNVQRQGGNEFGKGSAYNWTYDGRWHCAEWYVDYATQTYRFYFDGTEVSMIAITNGAGNFSGSEIPQVFTNLMVGWNNYQAASPGFVAWLDEIAVNKTRVGCGG